MLIEDIIKPRKFWLEKPRTPEEIVSAIYEELSATPLNKNQPRPEQTIKGYLHAIQKHMLVSQLEEKNRREDRSTSESFSLGSCGFLGLLFVLISSQSSSNSEWWNANSYFLFAFGTVLTVMFVAASIEKSSQITQMLRYNSIKLLCAFLFSATVVYSSAQANTVLNGIFGIDGSNLPFARAILTAVYFLKICTPFMFILAIFALIHIFIVWGSKWKDDFYSFPWNSMIFIVAALVSGGSYWWITHGAFGDAQIKQKAYKLAHYLDFNSKAYCIESSNDESYLFFGNDQNKILVDNKLQFNESFENFLKGTSIFGQVTLPTKFKVLRCSPAERPS